MNDKPKRKMQNQYSIILIGIATGTIAGIVLEVLMGNPEILDVRSVVRSVAIGFVIGAIMGGACSVYEVSEREYPISEYHIYITILGSLLVFGVIVGIAVGIVFGNAGLGAGTGLVSSGILSGLSIARAHHRD